MNQILLALIAALGAMVSTWLVARRTPGRTRTEEAVVAEAAGKLTGAASGLVTLLTNEINRLHANVEVLQLAASKCEEEISRAHRLLREAGIEPP